MNYTKILTWIIAVAAIGSFYLNWKTYKSTTCSCNETAASQLPA